MSLSDYNISPEMKQAFETTLRLVDGLSLKAAAQQLQAENERLKSRKGCCDDCFVVTESEKENKQLRADLDRARHYTGLEGYPCPLCTYKDGVFVESCEMHRQIDQLEAEPDKHRRDIKEWPYQTHLWAKSKNDLIEQLNCLFGDDLESRPWIPVEEE